MSRSLLAIAELAWRQHNPRGSDDAKHTKEEYIETAIDAYGSLAYAAVLEGLANDDLGLAETLLRVKRHEILFDEENGYHALLDMDVLGLPKDIGVRRVEVPGYGPLMKTTLVSKDLFKNDPGPKTYYRVNKTIFLPDGPGKYGAKEVIVATISLPTEDDADKLDVPDSFADPIRARLDQIYGRTLQVPADTTNNKNPNQ